MTELLAVREGALQRVAGKHRRRFGNWVPGSAEEGTATALWSLSVEALEELAQLAEAQLAEARVGVKRTTIASTKEEEERKVVSTNVVVNPDGRRGLTCLLCGIESFESREEQANHFSSEAHRATASRRDPLKKDTSVEEEKDDDDSEEEEEAFVDSDLSDDECELTRDATAGTAEVEVGDELVMSWSVAALGGRGYGGGRTGNLLKKTMAAQKVRDWADAKRKGKHACAVLALRSGKFAGCIIDSRGNVLKHATFSRYTTRRGQGGAQSTVDGSGKAPKSIGSQLRRHGERALAEEVRHLIADDWHEDLNNCAQIYVSAPRSMLTGLVVSAKEDDHLLDSSRLQRIPFALNRVTLAAVLPAATRLSTIFLHKKSPKVMKGDSENASSASDKKQEKTVKKSSPPPPPAAEPPILVPVVATGASLMLLEACEGGEESIALAVLEQATSDDLDVNASDVLGKRPLHWAAAQSATLVKKLFEAGADPTKVDVRGRVPYYFATDRKIRDAFREARADLGEEAFDWTAAAVPEALDAAARASKKAKDADKKKKQRERQKVQKQKQAEDKAKEDEAKKLKAARNANKKPQRIAGTCDACEKPILGPPFSRLDFKYCSTACVANHRRILAADAAEKRMAMLSASSTT